MPTTASPRPPAQLAVLFAELDPSGRCFAMAIHATPLGGPDPAVTTPQIFDTTYLYELDP